MSSSKPWTRRWSVWLVAIVLILFGIGAIGSSTSADDPDQAADPAVTTTPTEATEPTPSPEPTEDAAVLFVTDQKDGDSWVGSDGTEYRLGLVDTPERGEQCAAEATTFTREFLEDGFTVDAYATDDHGRSVAEVLDLDGRSLNVAIARSGLGGDRYLAQFRHENPDLARRVERALDSASQPDCRKAAKPVPLVQQVEKPKPKKKAPAKSCQSGYSPCLPIVADLNCPDIGHSVTVTGNDPYGLDRDGDGIGCD